MLQDNLLLTGIVSSFNLHHNYGVIIQDLNNKIYSFSSAEVIGEEFPVMGCVVSFYGLIDDIVDVEIAVEVYVGSLDKRSNYMNSIIGKHVARWSPTFRL